MFSKVTSGVLKRVKFALSPQIVTTPALNFNVAAQSKPSTGKVVAVIDTVVDRIALSNLPTSIALKLRNRDYVIGRRFYSKKPGSDVENEVEVNSHSAVVNSDSTVPYKVHAKALEEIGRLKAQLDSLKSAYRPLYAIVKTRQKVENWESLFGLLYPYENKRPDKKSMVTEVYNFHFHKWMWIYDHCTDTRWTAMKTDFENKGYDKKDVCGSIASVLSLMGNNIHFPAEIGTITTNEVCSCLEISLGVDSFTVDCVRTLFDVARK